MAKNEGNKEITTYVVHAFSSNTRNSYLAFLPLPPYLPSPFSLLLRRLSKSAPRTWFSPFSLGRQQSPQYASRFIPTAPTFRLFHHPLPPVLYLSILPSCRKRRLSVGCRGPPGKERARGRTKAELSGGPASHGCLGLSTWS